VTDTKQTDTTNLFCSSAGFIILYGMIYMIACMQSLTEILFRLIVTDVDGIKDGLG
jgi:hypothetical protein